MVAARLGHEDVLQVLLECMTYEDVIMADNLGNTCLHVAAQNGKGRCFMRILWWAMMGKSRGSSPRRRSSTVVFSISSAKAFLFTKNNNGLDAKTIYVEQLEEHEKAGLAPILLNMSSSSAVASESQTSATGSGKDEEIAPPTTVKMALDEGDGSSTGQNVLSAIVSAAAGVVARVCCGVSQPGRDASAYVVGASQYKPRKRGKAT